MGKQKNFSPKFTKSNTQALAKIMLASEQTISRDTFLKYSTENMLDKYVSSGLLTKTGQDGNYYQCTDAFKDSFRKEYCNKVNTDYAGSKFSQSKSLNHSAGIERIVSHIDRNEFFKDDVVIKSGLNLSEDWSKQSSYKSVRNKIDDIYQENLQLKDTYTQQIKDLQAIENKTYGEYSNLFQLEKDLKHCENVIELYEGKHDFASPPDVQLTMPIETFHNQIENLRSTLNDEDNGMTRAQHNSLERTINQMEEYYQECISESQEVISYSLEVVTSNYRDLTLEQKANFETITNTKVIYYKV